jgi:hypothetical protein
MGKMRPGGLQQSANILQMLEEMKKNGGDNPMLANLTKVLKSPADTAAGGGGKDIQIG